MVVRCVPFGLYILFLAIGPWIAEFLPPESRPWIYPLQVGTVVAALWICRRHYAELRDSGSMSAARWAMAVAAGAVVFVAWINLDLPGLRIGESRGYDPTVGGDHAMLLMALRVAGAALVVPLMEELFWRSFVMRWIDGADFLSRDPARLSLRALLLSSIAFALEHTLWFAGIVAGLAYGELYRRSRSLWSPILAHAVTNLMLGIWVIATGNWQFW